MTLYARRLSRLAMVLDVRGSKNAPTPSVPTNIPNTSASRAFWMIAYRRMRSLFTLPVSRRVDRVLGSYDITYGKYITSIMITRVRTVPTSL